MAGTIGVKIRDYTVAALFVTALAAGADILVSNAHAPDSAAYTAAAKAQEAASGLHAFASAARPSRWSAE